MRTITIKGKAELSVSPDYTTVVVFLKENDKNYKKALDKLQKKSAEITECVKKVGIELNDVKTTNYSAQAVRKSERDRKGYFVEVDGGYECSHTLKIGFKSNPELLNELINSISEKIDKPDMMINFSIKDRKKYEAELLRKVTEDAQSKAKIFCEPSNADIGKLISVDYQRGNMWSFPVRRINYQSHSIGNTEDLSLHRPQPPIMATMASATPGLALPKNQAPIVENIIPEDRIIEEEAIFVWEIIDKN